MDKILFIIPPYVNYESFLNPAFNDGTMLKETGRYRNIVADMPIGLLSLSAFLKKHIKVEVKLIDFNITLHKLERFSYSSFSDLFNSILSNKDFFDYNPNIIGISTLFTPSYHNMLALGHVARNIFPNALIIAGGGVPTVMYKEILLILPNTFIPLLLK